MRRRKFLPRLLCLLLILTLTAGCAGFGADSAADSETPPQSGSSTQPPSSEVPSSEPESSSQELPLPDRLLRQMSLREKVGQLFIVRPDALDPDAAGSGTTALTDGIERSLQTYPVGGVAMFGQNITSPDQITAFNADLQTASAIPLFISVDEEGGIVARLANNDAFDLPKYESAAAVAASGNADDALDMGRTIGEYLRRYGFNMDFAPDADVNTNPNNPVIGTRAFSSDAQTAAEMASAMADGLQQEGIIPVFKHFPGHGDTAEDSHMGVALSDKTHEQMQQCEWIPFSMADGSDCIMVGHITTPNLTDDSLPASLSPQVVTEILRGELGFTGLIITDSLEMGAIIDEYGAADAAVMAIEAGCDILLMPLDLSAAYDAVVSAVENGEISEARIDESVRRILQFKADNGLLPE